VPVQPGRDQLHRARITLADPYVESFGGRLRDELLAVEAFNTLLEAQVLVQDWRIEYNTVRPQCLGLPDPERLRQGLDTLEEVTAAAERGVQRIRRTHHLAFSFLRHCGLSLG
jgi:Integrase core domain